MEMPTGPEGLSPGASTQGARNVHKQKTLISTLRNFLEKIYLFLTMAVMKEKSFYLHHLRECFGLVAFSVLNFIL